MSFSVKNLRDVEDIAPRFGLGETQESRFPRTDLGAVGTGLAYHVIRPGHRGSAHRHEAAEEIYVVLKGSGRVKLDDEVIPIGPLDAIRVSPEVARAFEAGPEGLQLLVFGPRHEGDGEFLTGDFWRE